MGAPLGARATARQHGASATWFDHVVPGVPSGSIIDHDDHNTGDLVDTPAVTRRCDLTDAQRAAQEPLLPVGMKPVRSPPWSRRQLIDGIRRRVRGTPWGDIPAVYESWQATTVP